MNRNQIYASKGTVFKVAQTEPEFKELKKEEEK